MAIYIKISRKDIFSIEKKFNLGKIISYNGIKNGIEKASKYMMPILFLLFLILVFLP